MTVTLSHSDYRELKAFLAFYSENYMPIHNLPFEIRPIASLEVLEKKSYKAASQGLRQAINDIMERIRHIEPGHIAKIDSELKIQGLLTLSELRRRYSRGYSRLLKRAKIANETEYYLIRGVVDDGTAGVSKEERELLERMLANFEEKISASCIPK